MVQLNAADQCSATMMMMMMMMMTMMIGTAENAIQVEN